MSHGYGSLKGIIGVWFVAISVSLLMVLTPMASASAESPAPAVVVSATIAPVRIIVVDDHDRITEILSNAPGDITPSVHRGSSEGSRVAMSHSVSKQYTSIMSHTDQAGTGTIYKLQNDIARKPSRLFNPTVISILLVGAHLVL